MPIRPQSLDVRCPQCGWQTVWQPQSDALDTPAAKALRVLLDTGTSALTAEQRGDWTRFMSASLHRRPAVVAEIGEIFKSTLRKNLLADSQYESDKQPAQLLELKSVIEQVTLKELIAKFEDMLSQNLPEPKWQSFFMANPFVLSLAFPYPVILIQDQAHVGGTMLNGRGESIVDFLLAQRFTGNLAIIEIKHPATHLIEPRTFRGDLHAPHKDMTSAMAH